MQTELPMTTTLIHDGDSGLPVLPQTPLAREVVELVTRTETPSIANHSIRTYRYARPVAAHRGLVADRVTECTRCSSRSACSAASSTWCRRIVRCRTSFTWARKRPSGLVGVDPSQGQVAWQQRTLTTGHVELAPQRVTSCCHERRGGGDDHRDYRADHH